MKKIFTSILISLFFVFNLIAQSVAFDKQSIEKVLKENACNGKGHKSELFICNEDSAYFKVDTIGICNSEYFQLFYKDCPGIVGWNFDKENVEILVLPKWENFVLTTMPDWSAKSKESIVSVMHLEIKGEGNEVYIETWVGHHKSARRIDNFKVVRFEQRTVKKGKEEKTGYKITLRRLKD